ncbi:MAG TPA: shikimate kinase [Chloroflexi bacterium]|nr:MAG: shikimate kinase [Chloroflexota bacterium]HDD54872.1 shikimate kinase [Chloroflexota bacterium]
MKSIVILIGPMSAGKSTLAGMLAKKLDVPRVELDEVRQRFYAEIGYDEKFASEIVGREGMRGLIEYWKPFEAHAVERALEEYRNCVMDFGAVHSVYEDEVLFQRVQKALQPYNFVIQILPSPDLDRSVEIVNQRFSDLLIKEVGKIDPELLALNEHFVRHPSNQLLAKKTFYTEDRPAKKTCQAILDWIEEQGGFGRSLQYSQLSLF